VSEPSSGLVLLSARPAVTFTATGITDLVLGLLGDGGTQGSLTLSLVCLVTEAHRDH